VRPGLLHPTLDPLLADPDARSAPAPILGADVARDLELDVVVAAMASGDRVVAAVSRHLLLDDHADPDTIRYRHDVLRACLAHPDVVRGLYRVATRMLDRRAKAFWGLVRRPDAVVHHGMELVHLYVGAFRELRAIAERHERDLEPGRSGLGALLARLRREVDEPFLREVDAHVEALRFRAGVRMSARLGAGNAGTDYVLEPPERGGVHALARLARRLRRRRRSDESVLTYRLPPHDDSGVRALAELQARGLQRTASAVASACDDLLWYFRQLRGELAFYVGALALHRRLERLGTPTCFPIVHPASERRLQASELYDPSLALTLEHPVVGNDLGADDAGLMIVTGANGGGKTTFLRSLGIAQRLLHAGLFVPARAFEASVAEGIYTHFIRRADATMRRGRLDDELARLDRIVRVLRPGSLLLLNESFASTNEREGSELADGIVRALTEVGVRVVFVTHLTAFARALHARDQARTLFLRAERRPDGERTFRILPGPPQATSHGVELWHDVVP
jgi:hypothetical protein